MKRTGGERTLSASDVEAIAEATAAKVAELVGPPPPSPFALIDASTLAGELDVSVTYVYQHAAELGAMRLGEGPKARTRFDLDAARKALLAREARRRAPAPRRRRARAQ